MRRGAAGVVVGLLVGLLAWGTTTAAGGTAGSPPDVRVSAGAGTGRDHAAVAATRRGCRAGRVALTFDDGPSASYTRSILRTLRRLHVPATFFMVGNRVAAAPSLARLIDRAGYTIGNHSYDHTDLTGLTRAEIGDQLGRTAAALKAAGVRQRIRYVRPPYGATNARVDGVIARRKLTTVLWNVDSRDWDGLDSDGIVDEVVDQVRSHGRHGSVVLQHDGVANSGATLAALPREVAELRQAGYCFVAVPDVPATAWQHTRG